MSLTFDIHSTIFCMCEGAAESSVVDILLNDDKLIFKRKQLHDYSTIRRISAKDFEKNYLGFNFSYKPVLIRLTDRANEMFRLSTYYKDKIDVYNVVTRREIEMLVIHSENKYDDYKKSGKSPSRYCKENLRLPNIKKSIFWNSYYRNSEDLISAINDYDKKTQNMKSVYTLRDLIKPQFQ